MQAF
jgi:hypothetical protein